MGPFPCYADEFLSLDRSLRVVVEIREGKGGLHGHHSGNL